MRARAGRLLIALVKAFLSALGADTCGYRGVGLGGGIQQLRASSRAEA